MTGHELRSEDEACRVVALEFGVEGNRSRGRPRTRWVECVMTDLELRRQRGKMHGTGKWTKGVNPSVFWDSADSEGW